MVRVTLPAIVPVAACTLSARVARGGGGAGRPAASAGAVCEGADDDGARVVPPGFGAGGAADGRGATTGEAASGVAAPTRRERDGARAAALRPAGDRDGFGAGARPGSWRPAAG